MQFLIGYLKTFPLEMGGGQMNKSTCAMGVEVIANVHTRTIGRGGSNFCDFGTY